MADVRWKVAIFSVLFVLLASGYLSNNSSGCVQELGITVKCSVASLGNVSVVKIRNVQHGIPLDPAEFSLIANKSGEILVKEPGLTSELGVFTVFNGLVYRLKLPPYYGYVEVVKRDGHTIVYGVVSPLYYGLAFNSGVLVGLLYYFFTVSKPELRRKVR